MKPKTSPGTVLIVLFFLAACIADTTEWRSDRTLDKLPTFIETFTKDKDSLRRTPVAKGAPHTLIVAGAGLRAADIVR